MNNDVTGLGNNTLVVISSIGPPTSISSQAIQFIQNVATYLGGTGQGYIYGGTMSPSAYSLIGIPAPPAPATPAPATQVSTYANASTDGNIAGALVQDIHMNFAFVYSTFVTIQTVTGAQNDTIIVGNTAFEAPRLAPGTPGGFHVLVVDRMLLDRVKTNPAAVFLHTSYSTNSSNTSTAASETHRMASDLNLFQNALQNGLAIYIIASLGNNPGFNFSPGGASFADFITIEGVTTQLGGAGGLAVLGKNGYYSIVGIPNSGDPTLSPEVRSYATPQLSANITAVLQRNNAGLFTPVSSSAFPGNASLDFSLYSSAYAAPSKWPVAPHGSDPTCPPNAQQCAAYKWISWQILCNGNLLCTDVDVRGHYNDLGFDLTPVVHPAMAGVLWLELRICADGATDDRRSWSGLRSRSSVAVKVAA